MELRVRLQRRTKVFRYIKVCKNFLNVFQHVAVNETAMNCSRITWFCAQNWLMGGAGFNSR